MHKECQNVFIVEVVSLILLEKTQQTTGTEVLIAQIIAELNFN